MSPEERDQFYRGLCGRLSPAHGANGKITGKVTDSQSRERLPGVNILVTHRILSDGSEVPIDHPMGAASDAEAGGISRDSTSPVTVAHSQAICIGLSPL